MTFQINIDGTITDAEQATISVLDRGFLYGDSVYEVIRTYNGKPFALELHLNRLNQSAGRLGIPLPDRDVLTNELHRTLHQAGNDESYCRIIVTRGSGPLNLDPTTAVDPKTVIMVKHLDPLPDQVYEQGLRLAIPKVRRTSREALDPAIKSGNYLNSVLALAEVRKRGFDDALLLDRHGRITESTSSNVFVVIDGALVTPPLETGLLAGVTRGLILSLAEQNQISCREQQLTPTDLIAAQEVILTSTLREVISVVAVDDRRIGTGTPGPMAAKLRKILRRYAIEATQH
ncbi:MAG: aminotransferase class IV [Myxococcota bacterium]|nr:aminotransferase class IV [Myxococcota bacterium]